MGEGRKEESVKVKQHGGEKVIFPLKVIDTLRTNTYFHWVHYLLMYSLLRSLRCLPAFFYWKWIGQMNGKWWSQPVKSARVHFWHFFVWAGHARHTIRQHHARVGSLSQYFPLYSHWGVKICIDWEEQIKMAQHTHKKGIIWHQLVAGKGAAVSNAVYAEQWGRLRVAGFRYVSRCNPVRQRYSGLILVSLKTPFRPHAFTASRPGRIWCTVHRYLCLVALCIREPTLGGHFSICRDHGPGVLAQYNRS